MPSRYMARFPERKLTGTKKSTDGARGPKPAASMPMKTADWPTAGAGAGSGYNRATKAEVVKVTPKKAGMP